MKKALIIIIPILFTAQACNILFGDLRGEEGSGPRGVFLSTDSGQTWEAIGRVGKEKSLINAQVLSVFVEPADTKNILAATFNEGVYASDNGGEQWARLLSKFAAYAAFVNPGNSTEIFVAGNRNRRPAILKSPDRGGTWVEVFSQPAVQGSVTVLISDPRNSAVLYAGLTSGTVLKSLDGAQTWNAITDFNDRIVRMAFSPDGRALYVLGKSQGLRKSVDEGRTWSEVKLSGATTYNDLTVYLPGNERLYMATDQGLYTISGEGGWTKLMLPATPEANIVSAVAINSKNSRQIFAAVRSTIYRSDDRGLTWRTASLPTNRVITHIAVDPQEPNKVYVGLK